MDEKPQLNAQVSNGAQDLISRLYREIGISAVAAVLEVNKDPEKTKLQMIKTLGSNRFRDEEAA